MAGRRPARRPRWTRRGPIHPQEGTWDGDLIIIEFPALEAATAWYGSPGYQEILPLRTRNSNGMAALVEGVPGGYRAVDKLAELHTPRP